MMTLNTRFRCSCTSLIVALGTSLTLAGLTFAEPSFAGQAADVHTFEAPDGETYYAIALKGAISLKGAIALRGEGLTQPSSAPVEHVVLFDTSASQIGEHREHGLAVVEAFLKSLPAGDRVTLFAVDVQAVRMADAGVTVAEAQTSGLSALKTRFPAGSTDMVAGIQAALEQLDGSSTASVLYVGDGMSTANLVQRDDLQKLLGQLQARHIPVHTYAVGPNQDRQLLGILSHHTGGRAMSDAGSDESTRPAAQAQELAAATHRPVLYPIRIQLTPHADGLIGDHVLPLRSDQETIYLGRGELPDNTKVSIHGMVDGQPTTQTWSLSIAPKQSGNTFLYGFYRQSVRDGGLNPLAGMPMFRAAQQAIEDEIARLESVGERAIVAGNFDQAEQVGLTIKNVDPQNVRAEALIGAAGDLKVKLVAQNEPAEPNPFEVPADEPAPAEGPPNAFPSSAAPGDAVPPSRLLNQPSGDLTPRELESPQSLIDQADIRQTILSEKLASEINSIIEISRRRLAENPAGVEADLKTALATVKAATEIDPNVQAQLLRRVADALLSTQSQLEVLEANQIRVQQRLAENEAQQALIDAETREELRLEQMVDRIVALMREGFGGNPQAFEEAEAVARQVESQRPGAALGTQTVLWTEAAGHVDKAYRLRSLRADRFLAVLQEVELSHVPFPDEPPVLYPPPAVWRRLTARRVKWKSVDLHQDSPNEERVFFELEQDTELEFVDTPLAEAIDYIGQLHNITILIKDAELTDVGIPTDEPVNLIISNIRLRSALKIMLEPLGLTWVVDDEVMYITTQEDADETLQTRVYPVGDLVITPEVMIGNVGSGGGGGGGFGGGGGGFGGQGGGGFGGGGQGGGAQGGGGGFFSVSDPAEEVESDKPITFDNETISRLKKKQIVAE